MTPTSRTYFDGILWIVLGERPDHLLSIVLDQVAVLTGKRPPLENVSAATAEFAAALGKRSILIIVDDVWREGDLQPFLEGGPRCARLVTTRIERVLPRSALGQPVDAMQAGEALTLLSAGLPPDQVVGEQANLTKLAARLGEWAQLVKIVNGFLRDCVVRANEPLPAAVVGANKRLDAKGLAVFDPRDESDRTKTVARTIEVSLDLLSKEERARFGELGVFPEDADVNVGLAEQLW
jgi:hypothetical protein